MSEVEWIEGAIAVEAVMEAGLRKIVTVYVLDDRRDSIAAAIQAEARRREIPLERLPSGEFQRLTSGDQHGGIIAKVGPRRMLNLSDLVAISSEPIIVMLDGVEDPYNFAQSVRALYAAGIDGLVLRPRNWLTSTALVARASAGATERMPTAVVETPEKAAMHFQSSGFRVACATAENARPLTDVDLTGPLFLVIGGEKRGISRGLLAAADLRVQIPYGREFGPSLGTAAATAVLAFEVARQRRRGDSEG